VFDKMVNDFKFKIDGVPVGKVYYLQWLCNTYGDFKVAFSWKDKEGNIRWSKHRSVLSCWHSDEGIDFLERVNHRQMLKCEIIFDMDDDISSELLHGICNHIRYDLGLEYKAYFTGSKGYHIHVLDPKLILYNDVDRKKIRDWTIKQFKCDRMKAVESTMIALEGCKHWKTGNFKEKIEVVDNDERSRSDC